MQIYTKNARIIPLGRLFPFFDIFDYSHTRDKYLYGLFKHLVGCFGRLSVVYRAFRSFIRTKYKTSLSQ